MAIPVSPSRTCSSSSQRFFCSLMWLGFCLLTGCEEIGLQTKPDAPSASEVAAPVAAMPAELPPQPTMPTAAPAVQTPEQFVAEFQSKPRNQISDADLIKLAETSPANEVITELDLKAAAITSNGLAQLSKLPSLRKVDLSGCPLFGSSWAGIASAVQIEDLNVSGSGVDDVALASIGALVNLKSLNLKRTKISDVGFQHLTGLSKLETIACSEVIITGAGFKAFANAHAPLKVIEVSNTGFGAYGFEHIDGLKTLERLDAGTCGVTDKALSELKGMKTLKMLYLNSNPISDQGLKILSGLTQLEELNLNDTPLMSDFTLEKLRKHKSLKALHINNTSCTLAGCQELKKSLPDCRILFMNMEL